MKAIELLDLLNWLDTELGMNQKVYYLEQMVKRCEAAGIYVQGEDDIIIINAFLATV